jgi:general secretion pathway protein A
MYLKFYGLTEKPFELTPDPRFLFQTPGHREALAQLIYGVQEQKGFILMTGEVGTGKTTLLRTLVQRLNGQAECAFIINSTLPFDELLEYAMADFGVDDPRGTRAQRLMALNHFLIEQHRGGRKTILIIDEAQNLDNSVLEVVRMLSNFENSAQKLIQIILSGQPQLARKLASPEMQQLRQRLSMIARLKPFAYEDTSLYIEHRLRTAGYDFRYPLFTTPAIALIAHASEGIPRNINNICFNSLLLGRALERQEITRQMVCDVLADLDLASLENENPVGLADAAEESDNEHLNREHLGVAPPPDIPLGVEIP